MVAFPIIPVAQEAEAGGSQVQGYSVLHTEFHTIPDNVMKPNVKIKSRRVGAVAQWKGAA
jgi:hypothetical protein